MTTRIGSVISMARRTGIGWLAGWLVVGALAGPVAGQEPRGGGDREGQRQERRREGFMVGGPGLRGFFGGEVLSPSIDSRELDQYARTLGLTAEQRELIHGLFEGYQEQFRAQAAQMRQRMDEIRQQARESGDPAIWRQSVADMRRFAQARQRMEEEFFADFQAVLTDDQRARWPALERARRREKTLGRGLLSGERVDLVRLVDQAGLPPDLRASLVPILEQYEMDLDRELVARNRVYDESFSQLADMRGDVMENPDRLQQIMERGREASVRVRDVNRRYARLIESALPEEFRSAWSRAFNEASFPGVYRPSPTLRQITAAEGFADLDDAQRRAIASLKESFTRQLESVNQRLAAAQEQAEATATLERIIRRFRGEENDPLEDLRRQKRDLERSASESLRQVLTEAQRARLPAGGARGEGFFIRRGPDDDDGVPRRFRERNGGAR